MSCDLHGTSSSKKVGNGDCGQLIFVRLVNQALQACLNVLTESVAGGCNIYCRIVGGSSTGVGVEITAFNALFEIRSSAAGRAEIGRVWRNLGREIVIAVCVRDWRNNG